MILSQRPTSKTVYGFIANELSNAILSDPELRSFISVEKRPTYDMTKIGDWGL
jgi:hypothetical protein